MPHLVPSPAPPVAPTAGACPVTTGRLPAHRTLLPACGPRRPLPLMLGRVPAGFPSPADDYIDKTLDLNEHLILRPEATFFLRVQGDSMIGAGIHDNDILIVDRAERPVSGKIVVAVVDGELTVKRLRHHNDAWFLLPENPEYRPMQIPPESDFEVWGVVRHVVHSV